MVMEELFRDPDLGANVDVVRVKAGICRLQGPPVFLITGVPFRDDCECFSRVANMMEVIVGLGWGGFGPKGDFFGQVIN